MELTWGGRQIGLCWVYY